MYNINIIALIIINVGSNHLRNTIFVPGAAAEAQYCLNNYLSPQEYRARCPGVATGQASRQAGRSLCSGHGAQKWGDIHHRRPPTCLLSGASALNLVCHCFPMASVPSRQGRTLCSREVPSGGWGGVGTQAPCDLQDSGRLVLGGFSMAAVLGNGKKWLKYF